VRNSDTYKGFVYQKKCAFLLLLREIVERTGATAFRMEHPKGDDFDLIYDAAVKVFQTKDVQEPNMVDCLAKMWRRYTENMMPNERRKITLEFIFSMHHAEDNYFTALSTGHVQDPCLAVIFTKIDQDPLTQFPVRTQAIWEEFLAPITVRVLPVEDLDTELRRSLGFMFLSYELPSKEVDSVGAEFLGRLDEVMQHGRQVPTNEVREVIREWFVRYSMHHPMMKESARRLFADTEQRLAGPPDAVPSATATGTL